MFLTPWNEIDFPVWWCPEGTAPYRGPCNRYPCDIWVCLGVALPAKHQISRVNVYIEGEIILFLLDEWEFGHQSCLTKSVCKVGCQLCSKALQFCVVSFPTVRLAPGVLCNLPITSRRVMEQKALKKITGWMYLLRKTQVGWDSMRNSWN